jgi:hypothetical protein
MKFQTLCIFIGHIHTPFPIFFQRTMVPSVVYPMVVEIGVWVPVNEWVVREGGCCHFCAFLDHKSW